MKRSIEVCLGETPRKIGLWHFNRAAVKSA